MIRQDKEFQKMGEIDLLVYDDSIPVAIIEALKMSSVNKKYLSEHIEKVLVNYDPNVN